MIQKIVFAFCIAWSLCLQACWAEAPYNYNPCVEHEVWFQLEPYFLPIHHPIKGRLDKLFCSTRATLSKDSLRRCGFHLFKTKKATNVVVAKHPHFKGYIFKLFLDSQPPVGDWENWLRRIRGAQAIRNCIDRHGFQHFAVPQKWIYPLPEHPSPPLNSRFHRKNFILIAEEMPILDNSANHHAFKKYITPQLLDDLYVVFTEVGLLDSVYPDNIPFTREGKIAFIDTEHHSHPTSEIPLHKLTPYLSPKMQLHWQALFHDSTE